ncbi:MAG TPA: hypothetical protein VKP30_14050, partial [Polyangiaceae bacterium]|nr:hypothetical protein [Polyangiaceae bacterium]
MQQPNQFTSHKYPKLSVSRRQFTCAACLAAIGPVGCYTETSSEVSEPASAIADQQLIGTMTYGSDCSATNKAFLDVAIPRGRISAASLGFADCLDRAMRAETVHPNGVHFGPYKPCKGDPFEGNDINYQIRKALDAARSENAVTMYCTGGFGNASAGIGPNGHTDPEVFRWNGPGGWLDGVDENFGYTHQAAAIIWHEAMHTHGYLHGANDPDTELELAATNCGYKNSTEYHFQKNSVPYIVDACISAVLDRSAGCDARYGATFNGCGSNGLGMVLSYSSQSCECVADPNLNGLAMLSVPTSYRL